jgi:putative phosphoribosyl transferase
MFGDESEIFEDRRDAGRRLAAHLDLPDENAIVLGLARGGVLVADEVARALDADLDVLVVRKLGAPWSEELAIGAVSANDGVYVNNEAVLLTGAGTDYLAREIEAQRDAARVREARYRRERPASSLEGRPVILVDDGLATGASMIAALRSARAHGAAQLTVAVPVGAPESCRELSDEADSVVCLLQPVAFGAVGRFYRDFSEVADEEVESVLASARHKASQRGV